jgi:hypothetical protein
MPLTPEAQALAERIGELLKGAKVGQTVTLPPDLAQAIDDSVREATAPAIMARRRMEWLHSRGDPAKMAELNAARAQALAELR